MLEAPANGTGPIIGFDLLRPKHISSIVRFLHKIVPIDGCFRLYQLLTLNSPSPFPSINLSSSVSATSAQVIRVETAQTVLSNRSQRFRMNGYIW